MPIKIIAAIFILLMFPATTFALTETLRPDRDDSPLQWSLLFESKHFLEIDEVTADGSATMVRETTLFQTDVFGVDDFTLPAGSVIDDITIFVNASKQGGDVGQIRFGVEIGTTLHLGKNQGLTTTYTEFSHTYTTNPSTGDAWTQTNLNNFKPYIRAQFVSGGVTLRVTQVFVQVNYTVTEQRHGLHLTSGNLSVQGTLRL